MNLSRSLVTLALLIGATAGARAELAISANDGKQMPAANGTVTVPDTVSVIDIKNGKAKLLGSLTVPASKTGPPTSVAVSRDGRFALVTACQKLEGGKLVPDDIVSVIDLSVPANPKVLQTLHAGSGASGVSISPNGKLALVASTGDDFITVFSIAGKTLGLIGKVQVDPKSAPTDVVFFDNGKSAVAVGRGNSKLMVLSVNGTAVTNAGTEWSPGQTPYGAIVTPDGKYVLTANLGGAPLPPNAPPPARGAGPRPPATVSMINSQTGSIAASVNVIPTPEHLMLSADGKYLAVVASNGVPTNPTDPNFGKIVPQLKLYSVGHETITPVADVETGHACQGAAFSRDGRTILVQCDTEKDIEVFHFNGKTLTRDTGNTLFIGSLPGAIATAASR